ncbi:MULTISPECIES: hypothetical protein [unclassified Shewanella]|uniref:hypothetical protein n=1 Tax=unclassified Shewanella TaxID=196818 RepID=UPI0035509D49
MCKQASYSKYQKSVIKFLNDLLGTRIPFTYERTQNNHLKVLVDGVPKPLYTGSTPSDIKSINNFMSYVKKELRAVGAESELNTADQTPSIQSVFQPSFEKLIQTCIKSLRTRTSSISEQEKIKILELNDIDFIKKDRIKIVKHTISHTLQSNRQRGYIKPKAMKEIEASIIKHLNFMLPSMAFYSDLIVSANSDDKVNDDLVMVNNLDETLAVVLQAPEPTCAESTLPSKPGITTKPEISDKQLNAPAKIMQLSTSKRVNSLRTLTNDKALELIKDIEQAMSLNREQDIEAVVALIREKSIPMDAIISRLEAA